MSKIIEAKGLTKRYGSVCAVKSVDLSIDRGKIVALVGPNGAGKTTILKSLLGLIACEGDLKVLGLDPRRQRLQLMQKVCFIPDLPVLPGWLRVAEILKFVAEVHPHFVSEKADYFLSKTEIRQKARIKELSKGMALQLHLAIVMAIEAELLVLDEPMLGLDILYRNKFMDQILTDFFEEDRSVLIATHQFEEVQNIISDLIFIKGGQITLDASMNEVNEKYVGVAVSKENILRAEALGPIMQRNVFGRQFYIFEGVHRAELESLGELHPLGIADLFVAMMKEGE